VYWSVIFAGISGAIMVAMGAYATHGGGGEIARGWLATGAQFGLWHSIALLGIAAMSARSGPSRLLTWSGIAFAAGIVLFSFTLFLRALTPLYWISKLTPLGGLCFIAGWLLLAAYGVARYLDDDSNRP
jgi:uncharacterized membrane protein YgdD (TMEM256/DUF423 family)